MGRACGVRSCSARVLLCLLVLTALSVLVVLADPALELGSASSAVCLTGCRQ